VNNDDKMPLIDEGARGAAMRLRVVAEQGRSGQFSCPEMTLAASAILALRERAELAERVSAVYRQASLIPMWNRWSVRLGRFDLMNTWSTEEAALSALDAALGLDAKPAGEGGTP
jgi:hypothetical protein